MGNTKGIIGTLLLATLLAACAPAAGRPAITYEAEPTEIINALAQAAPLFEPIGGFNYLSIETIGEAFITLRTDPTTGANVTTAILFGVVQSPIRVTVTTLSNSPEGITQVAISGTPAGGSNTNRILDLVIEELDKRFRRAPGTI